MPYDPQLIEPKWQQYWDEHAVFRVDIEPGKPKLYVLDMFPYPSGAGLHVGHPEGYTATDILCRYKRMRGFNVLHPMGWDAFGLPAERYAMRTGVHPAITTQQNIDTFRGQIKRLGFSYDWSGNFPPPIPATCAGRSGFSCSFTGWPGLPGGNRRQLVPGARTPCWRTRR